MPSSKVAPANSADDGMTVGKARTHGKKPKPKEDAAGGKKKFVRKGDDDPFGDPDQYPDNMPLGARHLVEFHERADKELTLRMFGDTFSAMLPREQTMCFQKMLLFDQMVGRLISHGSRFAYETDYLALVDKLRDGVKQVLGVQKVRLFGVDYNSLGLARQLWMVSGEPSLLGHAVGLDEWAGLAATGPPTPVISHDPTSSYKKYLPRSFRTRAPSVGALSAAAGGGAAAVRHRLLHTAGTGSTTSTWTTEPTSTAARCARSACACATHS